MGMNLPVDSKISILGWHTFHLPVKPRTLSRDPMTGRIVAENHYRVDVEEWCMNHLKGQWSESKPESGDHHSFRIQDGKDAMLFKLTWCQDTVKLNFR